MGFWSGLGKVAKFAAPIAAGAATLMTGGAAAPLIGIAAKLAAAGKIAGIAGGVAGSFAKGREAGRDKENSQAMTQDALRLQAARDLENAMMNRAELELKQKGDKRSSQEDSFRKSILGALTKNMQDGSFNRPEGVPNISLSGGMRPSALGVEGRAAGEELNKQAMLSLLNGEKYADVAGPEKFAPTEMKKGSAIDAILGTVGAVGGVADRVRAEGAQDEQNSFIRKLMEQAQAAAQGGQAPIVGLGDYRVPNIPRR